MPKKKLKSPTKGGPIGNGRPIVPPSKKLAKAAAKKPVKAKKVKSPTKGGPGGDGRSGGILPP